LGLSLFAKNIIGSHPQWMVHHAFKLKQFQSDRACPVLKKKTMSKANKNKRKSVPQGGNGKKMEQFGLLYPRSAGIDVGSMLMVVSYTDLQDMIHLREFNSFTESLYQLADLLKQEGVEVVAMEATGSYWTTLFGILEDRGMQVIVLNPSHYRNVAAQKTDVKDAQWLHQLLTHGLLRNSHIAPEHYRELRYYLHERKICQDQKSDVLNRIQRILTTMNIKFQHLISDIEGVAGMKLLRAISSGVSDPETLLKQIDYKLLKASPEDLLSSFKGDYREHQINILKCNLKQYDFFKEQMLGYEIYIEKTLKNLLPPDFQRTNQESRKKGYVRKNQYHFNLKDYLHAICGVDLTEVEGLDEIGLLTILAVTGNNMSKWPTAAHFSSWLNLSPRPKITGGRIVGYEKRITHNPATQAFRMAANSLWQSKGPLGQQYRKLAASKGKAKAIKAVARKLTVIFYNMILKQEAYDVKKIQQDVEKQTARKMAYLQKEAAKLGLIIQKAA
jgi:transposase